MLTTDVRRSLRARKAVHNYADEQPAAKKKPAPDRKRKSAADGDSSDDVIQPQPAKRAKNTAMRTSASKKPGAGGEHDEYDGDDDGTKPQQFMTYPKRGQPPPLEQQTHIKPQSNLYPVPEQVEARAKAWHGLAAETCIERARTNVTPPALGGEEIRLRPHVPFATEGYNSIFERATTHKMIVLNRGRQHEEDCHAGRKDCPREMLKIAGSKGDVYTITISRLPSCTCPVGLFPNKGILKVIEPLKYQSAFLTSELREIFAKAPALPTDIAADTFNDGNRKPIADDCSICFTRLEEEEESVWCKASCGNNVHKSCFEHWAKTKPGNATCVYCRAPWEDEGKQKAEVTGVEMPMERSASGYCNVRHLLDYD